MLSPYGDGNVLGGLASSDAAYRNALAQAQMQQMHQMMSAQQAATIYFDQQEKQNPLLLLLEPRTD